MVLKKNNDTIVADNSALDSQDDQNRDWDLTSSWSLTTVWVKQTWAQPANEVAAKLKRDVSTEISKLEKTKMINYMTSRSMN